MEILKSLVIECISKELSMTTPNVGYLDVLNRILGTILFDTSEDSK